MKPVLDPSCPEEAAKHIATCSERKEMQLDRDSCLNFACDLCGERVLADDRRFGLLGESCDELEFPCSPLKLFRIFREL